MKTSLPKTVTIQDIQKENYRTKSFVLSEKIIAKPGQFVMIWLPGEAEKPFSISDIDPFTITVQSVGNFSKLLNSKLKINDQLWYRGPFGKGVFKIKKGKKILVAGGCGCVPLYAFAKSFGKTDRKSSIIILGAQNKKELMFEQKFKDLGFQVEICTDDGSRGTEGFTTQILKKVLAKSKVTCVYSCGPAIMLEKIKDICEKEKISYQLSLEKLMKCGFGVCGSCSKGGKLVCLDGPVFKYEKFTRS